MFNYEEKRNKVAALQNQGAKMFRNANGSGAQNKMEPFTDTLTVEISLIANGTSQAPIYEDGIAILFDSQNPDVDAENADNGIKVVYTTTTPGRLREKIKTGGFTIESAILHLGVSEQLSKTWRASWLDFTGQGAFKAYSPSTMRKATDQQALIVDLPDFNLPVDPLARLEIPIVKELAAGKVVLVMKLNAIVQPGAEMFGKSTLQTKY